MRGRSIHLLLAVAAGLLALGGCRAPGLRPAAAGEPRAARDTPPSLAIPVDADGFPRPAPATVPFASAPAGRLSHRSKVGQTLPALDPAQGAALPRWTEDERRRRCLCLQRARRASQWITVGALGAMVLYGVAYYDYGDSNWQIKSDGWFEPSNKDGGADKTGHATSAHIETAAFAWINRRLGIPRKEAALRGAISAFALSFTMEVGDGFSDQFGFSWTDIVANAVGCTFGYFHASDPRFARLFDLRWEYWPSRLAREGKISEYTTDIEGSAHLLAINVGALVSERPSLWDLADIQVGYMARNYKDPRGGDPERRLFIGVGLNVANALRKIGLRKIAWFFEYYQVPFTSLRLSTDLNS